MTTTISSVQVRRAIDRSHHRKPLRMQITRRRTGKPAGAPPSGAYGSDRYVTQVRFGGREAVVLPWELGAVADGPDAALAAAER